MPRILIITQEKGGVGKTIFARALAEAIVDAPIIEVDANRRMIELGDRVQYFKMRADRNEIEKTGGKASRAEFDGVLTAIEKAKTPTIVDIGANTSETFLAVLSEVVPVLVREGFEFGVCVVLTNEPGALAATPTLLSLAKPWAKSLFLIENLLHGPAISNLPRQMTEGITTTSFINHLDKMDQNSDTYLQAGGLATIAKLDEAKLREAHGLGLSIRIMKDLKAFRDDAMDAVRPAAEWLIG
jgi:hypothetical protein